MCVANANAAKFVCQPDVARPLHPPRASLVDEFRKGALIDLDQYQRALRTSTGRCLDSAEARIQTYDSATGTNQIRCITRYRDVEPLVKHSDE